MEILTGIPVSPGAAMGVIAIRHSRRRVPAAEKASSIEAERCKYEQACKTAVRDLEKMYDAALLKTDEETASIFQVHQMMIEDPDFREAAEEAINAGFTAEYAVAAAEKKICAIFESIDDAYMREREKDAHDVSAMLLRIMRGEEDEKIRSNRLSVLIADDLTPAEIINLDRTRICALVMRHGSANSHAAILARTMGLPAAVGIAIPEGMEGTDAIVYGDTGSVIIDPNPEQKEKYLEFIRKQAEKGTDLKSLIYSEAVTSYGTRIKTYANIGCPDDADAAIENGAEGIGLYRSEFLYIGRDSAPSEDELFQAYRTVLEKMGSKPVIIRTMDIGADKMPSYIKMPKETNPAMGLRGIRFCLKNKNLFRTQLRAIFRAAVFGNALIMYPMISDISEVEAAKAEAQKALEELRSEGISCSETPQGIMIETPAAALISDLLAKKSDFFSIGTNDLTQYAMAADRENSDVSDLCSYSKEAVIRLVSMTALNARKAGIPIGICGSAASDFSLTEKFAEIGIEELSVEPMSILPLKEKIISL